MLAARHPRASLRRRSAPPPRSSRFSATESKLFQLAIAIRGKKKYKNMPKPGSELPCYLNDMYQVFLFSFNEYKFRYHTKRKDKITKPRKNQAQKCFESIKDDKLMVLPKICDIWKATVQKKIKDSLDKIYENIVTVDNPSDLSKKGKEEKTIQKPEWKSIIDSIEKTFDSIIDEYNNSIQIMRIAKNIPLIF